MFLFAQTSPTKPEPGSAATPGTPVIKKEEVDVATVTPVKKEEEEKAECKDKNIKVDQQEMKELRNELK